MGTLTKAGLGLSSGTLIVIRKSGASISHPCTKPSCGSRSSWGQIKLSAGGGGRVGAGVGGYNDVIEYGDAPMHYRVSVFTDFFILASNSVSLLRGFPISSYPLIYFFYMHFYIIIIFQPECNCSV